MEFESSRIVFIPLLRMELGDTKTSTPIFFVQEQAKCDSILREQADPCCPGTCMCRQLIVHPTESDLVSCAGGIEMEAERRSAVLYK